MDAETKDTTDYVATISPELLNLSKKDYDVDINSDIELKCNIKPTHCSFIYYFFIFILFFILFQIVLKLKMIHYRINTILSVITTMAFKVHYIYSNIKKTDKPEEKPNEKSKQEVLNDFVPNLNYILEFIQEIDKKAK